MYIMSLSSSWLYRNCENWQKTWQITVIHQILQIFYHQNFSVWYISSYNKMKPELSKFENGVGIAHCYKKIRKQSAVF